jgi:hypothetical protein
MYEYIRELLYVNLVYVYLDLWVKQTPTTTTSLDDNVAWMNRFFLLTSVRGQPWLCQRESLLVRGGVFNVFPMNGAMFHPLVVMLLMRG